MNRQLWLLPVLVFSLVFPGVCSTSFGQEAGEQAVVTEEKAPEALNSDAWAGQTVKLTIRNDELTNLRRLRDIEQFFQKAAEEEVAGVQLVVDCSAELAWDQWELLLKALSAAAPLDVTVFIPTAATGSGASFFLIADELVMAEGAVLGAITAKPASPSADDEKAAAQTELTYTNWSVLEARLEAIARRQGIDPDLLQAMINQVASFEREGEIYATEESLLTLRAAQAAEIKKGDEPFVSVVADESAFSASYGEVDDARSFTPQNFAEWKNRQRMQEARERTGETAADTAGAIEDESETTFLGRKNRIDYAGKVVVITVGQDTLVSGKASFDFMERTLRRAQLQKAEAVIFDLDTPGGIAWYTQDLILDVLQATTIPTYAFVNTRAESAGAIIAVGTDEIYMRPAATIGSALVVSGGGQDLPSAIEDKVTQMLIGSVRNVAELNGHNPDIAEAFVTQDKEVVIDGVVVHEAGNVLNLNTIRATEEIGGKPVLAAGIAMSVEDLADQEGLEGEIVQAEALGLENFAQWVQRFAFAFIIVGIAGVYLELKSPGFGLPGAVGLISFAIFFFGNNLAGNLAGYELAVVLALGIVLIALEIFVFPGMIIPGLVGTLLVLGSLAFAMVDRVDFEWQMADLPAAEGWLSLLGAGFRSVVIGLAGATGLILLGIKYLPQTRLANPLILAGEVGDPAVGEEASEVVSLVGQTGMAITPFMPSGKVRIEGKDYNAVSMGPSIDKGEEIQVLQHEGNHLVVKGLS